MSRRNGPKLDLKLNLSPQRVNRPQESSPSRSPTVSPQSSCVSSELDESLYSSSPETTSMMLVGCPRCLMYVMLAEEDPRCPKCKSTVLLEVIHDNKNTTCILTAFFHQADVLLPTKACRTANLPTCGQSRS